MTARVVPGAIILIMDHNVITLADAGRETAFLSWYAIAYHATLGAGNVALVEAPARDLAVVLTDDLGLGERWQQRLLGMGTERACLQAPPVLASFVRRPYGPGGFGVRITAGDLVVEGDWAGATVPFWVDGEHGAFHATEDIWSAFIEAPEATIAVNGERLPGRAFPDEHWTGIVGRPLSSAHGAFSEVRVTPTPIASSTTDAADVDGSVAVDGSASASTSATSATS